jgi:hypothetical protein
VGAQLTQLTSLSVVAIDEVTGPDGRPVLATELLGGLPALSRLTRLTSLTVEGQSSAGAGGVEDDGVAVRDVVLALPPGAALEQVRRCAGGGLGAAKPPGRFVCIGKVGPLRSLCCTQPWLADLYRHLPDAGDCARATFQTC